MTNFDSIQTNKIGFLDVGNSSIKLGIRKEDSWEIQVFTKPDDLTSTLLTLGIEYLIVSNVRPSTDWLEGLSDFYSIAILETKDIHQSKLKYKTPETLGMDRYLACLGAWNIYKDNVLVIDAGSACTLDFMEKDGVFHGGVIMPGMQTLMGVFHKNAPGLPNFDFNIPTHFPGSSSKESLEWGLSQLFLDGVRANIERFTKAYPAFKIVITGGDAESLASNLEEKPTFRPDLIFVGMEAFLED